MIDDNFAQSREGHVFFRNVGRIATSLDRLATVFDKSDKGAKLVGEAVNVLRDFRERRICRDELGEIDWPEFEEKFAQAEITLEKALDALGVVK